MKRLNYIDSLKGIGIILVLVVHHFKGVDFVLSWIHSFIMPLFFAISGFLFSDKDNSMPIGAFVARKAKSLMYPYFTLSAVLIVWHFLFYTVLFPASEPEVSTLNVLFLTLSTYGYHAFWFVPCLFYSSTLFFLLKRQKYGKHAFALLLLLVLVFGTYYHDYFNVTFPYIYKFIFRTVVATSFVWLGYEFKHAISKITLSVENIILSCSIFVSVILLFITANNPNEFPFTNLSVASIRHPLVFYITSISNSLMLFFIFKKMTFLHKGPLVFWGKNTFLVLAFHMDISIEIAWLLISLFKLQFSETLLSIIAILFELVILYIIIMLVNRYFKFLLKYPFDKLTNKKQYI